VSHDDEGTVREAKRFYADFPARIEAETRALAGDGIAGVFSDIAPLGFEVAARLGVPSIALANFTWDWVYETHPGFVDAAPEILPIIRAAYGRATLALELPFSGGFEVFPAVERIPLVARRPTRGRAETRAHFGLPGHGRVALLSFGGYGLASLDLAAVDARGPWTIVTTDHSSGAAAPVSGVRLVSEDAFLGRGFRYEDLVAAADVVVTKPGYGIISECIAGDTAMLYTSRGHFREYDLLVDALPGHVRCRFISQADLFGGRWRDALEAVIAQPAPLEPLATNGAEVAAETMSGIVLRKT
jgi:L-arabinokinase